MELIKIHLMDDSIIVNNGEVLTNKKIVGTGSKYGRFIFNGETIGVILKSNAKIENCHIENFDMGVFSEYSYLSETKNCVFTKTLMSIDVKHVLDTKIAGNTIYG